MGKSPKNNHVVFSGNILVHKQFKDHITFLVELLTGNNNGDGGLRLQARTMRAALSARAGIGTKFSFEFVFFTVPVIRIRWRFTFLGDIWPFFGIFPVYL